MSSKITVTFKGDNVLFNGVFVGFVEYLEVTDYRGSYCRFCEAHEPIKDYKNVTGYSQTTYVCNGVRYAVSIQTDGCKREMEQVKAYIQRYSASISKRIHPELRALGGF